MRPLLETVSRARAHAGRFPRGFWILIGGDGIRSLGYGLFLPYSALYLTDEIGGSGAQAGAILAVWVMMGLVASPLAGVLADRVGRRPVMLVSLGLGGVFGILFGSLSSLVALAVVGPLWGALADLYGPAASAYIADTVEEELRTEAYGLERISENLGIAIGPPLGAVIVLVGSLGWTFVLAGIAELVFFLIVWQAVPESRPAHLDEHEPARLREALRDRLLLAVSFGVALGSFVYAQYEDVLGVFLHTERGFAIATWGLVFGINPLVVALCQYPIARWASRRPARAVLIAGTLLQGLALFLLWPFSGLAVLVVAALVLTAGEMLTAPVSSALVANLAPARLRATYQSVLSLTWAASVGPAVLIGLALVGAGHGEVMLALALPLAAIGSLAFLALPGKPLGAEAVVEAA